MILVILAVCIALVIFAVLIGTDDAGMVLFSIGVVSAIICIVSVICLCEDVFKLRVIDDKIAMYQEENTAIEEQVDILVQNYMEHEAEVYGNAKTVSPIVLAQMYPEIKSDKLIKSQIDIYVANNEKIKDLKLDKINGAVNRWWLYFGK